MKEIFSWNFNGGVSKFDVKHTLTSKEWVKGVETYNFMKTAKGIWFTARRL
jgi:hypothetical protein